MHKLELDAASAEALRGALGQCLQASREARYAQRVQCLLLISLGHGCAEVAEWFGKTPRTLERWVRIYQRFGMAGLWEDKKTGRWPALDPGRLRSIEADLQCDPRQLGYPAREWCGRLLREHIRKKFGTVLSERQAQRLLGRLRYRLGQPVDATPLPSLAARPAAGPVLGNTGDRCL